MAVYRNRGMLVCTIDNAIIRDIEKLAKIQKTSKSRLVEKFILQALDQEKHIAKVMCNPVLSAAICNAFANPSIINIMMRELGQELNPQQLELFRKAVGQLGKGV
jgi:hypothetical protein